MDDSLLQNQTHTNPITATDEPVDFAETLTPPSGVAEANRRITESLSSKSSERTYATFYPEPSQAIAKAQQESARIDELVKKLQGIKVEQDGKAELIDQAEGLIYIQNTATLISRLKTHAPEYAWTAAAASTFVLAKILESKGMPIPGLDQVPTVLMPMPYAGHKRPISRLAEQISKNGLSKPARIAARIGDYAVGVGLGVAGAFGAREAAEAIHRPEFGSAVAVLDDIPSVAPIVKNAVTSAIKR